MSAKPELEITISTDPNCPWCSIGHARLMKTLSSSDFSDKVGKFMTPNVKLLPFILDPRLPSTSFKPPEDVYEDLKNTAWTEGKPPSKREYYNTKFVGGIDAFDKKITDAAQSLDLPKFDFFSETGLVGATWDTHRLVQKADSQCSYSLEEGFKPSAQIQLMERFYKAFHNESKDLSDRKITSQLAHEMGIFQSQEEAFQWLQSDEMEYEVKQLLQIGKMNGVESIPFLIVSDGADHLSSTGDHETFMRMFNMAAANHK